MKASKRTIYLPAIERSVTLAEYILAVKLALRNPDLEFRTGLKSFFPVTGRELVGEFRQQIDERVNEATPYLTRGKGFSVKRQRRCDHG